MNETVHTAYAAALMALRQLTACPGHPRVLAALDQAEAALAQIRWSPAASAVTRLLAEVRDCHESGLDRVDRLGATFRAARLATAGEPALSG
jgi:hypothetical protein